MELANLIARVPVKKIKQANPDRFSQQGQSVIESLIMAGCLLPLIFGFFQMMLFFSYQHISNYLAHETLICLQENQIRKKAASLNTCKSSLEKSLRATLLFAKIQPVEIKSARILNRHPSVDLKVDLKWTLGLFKYQKNFQPNL
jgi:hypothetical protein